MSNKIALKPLSAVAAAITDTLVFMPMHGGGTATIGVTGVSRGNPTTVSLASPYTGVVGQKIKLLSLGGMTALNGYQKVIGTVTNGVVIDVDTSDVTAYPAWTSGGSISTMVLSDIKSTLSPQDIQGTTTGVWANPSDGLTSHLAGTNTPKLAGADLTPFDLTGYSGIAVLAFDIYINAAPGSRETIFGMGVIGNGGNSKTGTLSASIGSGGTAIELVVRPATAVDATGANTFAYSASIGAAAYGHVAFVFDFTNPASAIVHSFTNGLLTTSTAISLTAKTDWPSSSNGVVIGAGLDAALAIATKLGAGTTTQSGARIQNLLWWKSSKSMTQTIRAVNRLARNKCLNWDMV